MIAAVIPDRRVFRSGRDFAAVGRRREKRGLEAAPGVRSSSCWGWQPLPPSHHVLEEKALQQRGRRRLVDSVMSRCALRSNPPFGAPGKPPLAAQQVAVGQHFARQILRVHPDERIFGKRADIGPEYEGALAVAGRQRPRVVRRRQTGILDIGDFRRRNEVDIGAQWRAAFGPTPQPPEHPDAAGDGERGAERAHAAWGFLLYYDEDVHHTSIFILTLFADGRPAKRQGNRVKESSFRDEACEEVVVPCGGFALQAHGAFCGGISHEVARYVFYRGEVGGSVILTDAAFVVAENHVHHPMAAILYRPMIADEWAKNIRQQQ